MSRLDDKTVLVTGGTGTFGRRIVRTLLEGSVERIIVFSRDEKKQYDMANALSPAVKSGRLEFRIGNVRDRERVFEVMPGADIVLHAAALKHVVGCEKNPYQSVLTNVIGAKNVIDAARYFAIERVVAISTDKAVLPINVMGMCKALQERLVIDGNRGDDPTRLACVRYGNVLGSRGSVVPYFRSLLAEGKTELPLTHPRMTRFLLTVDDAVELVTHAVEYMSGGEIFVRKAPSTHVSTIGIALADMMSLPHPAFTAIPFVHGEKLAETLVAAEETWRAEDACDYYIIRPDAAIVDDGAPWRGVPFVSDEDPLGVIGTRALLERSFTESAESDGFFTKG